MCLPMPCPPNSRTTLHPWERANSSMAAPTSPNRPPGLICSSPTSRQRSATLSKRRASGEMSPTAKVREVSPWKPSSSVVTSTLTMSPACSTRDGDGMPWHTTSLTLVQTAAGNASRTPRTRYPSWLGRPPRAAVSSRTQRSMSAVVIPGRIRVPTSSSVAAAARPAAAILSISLGPNRLMLMPQRAAGVPAGPIPFGYAIRAVPRGRVICSHFLHFRVIHGRRQQHCRTRSPSLRAPRGPPLTKRRHYPRH